MKTIVVSRYSVKLAPRKQRFVLVVHGDDREKYEIQFRLEVLGDLTASLAFLAGKILKDALRKPRKSSPKTYH
jgi:hypothetical protein